MAMTDHHHSAPVPVGDVVSGDPPVPITVWTVPAPPAGATMSNSLGVRLVHNLTHPGDLVIDLTAGPQLARAIIAARRRSHLQSPRTAGWDPEATSLVVTRWPPDLDRVPEEFLDRCRAALRPGGCVAILLPHGDPTLPADVVIAAKAARLAYLQHVVAATTSVRCEGQFDIHTDVLIMTRSTRNGDDAHG